MAGSNVTKKESGYKIVGVVPGKVYYKKKVIDLRTISKSDAMTLVKDPNFPYLVESGS